MRFIPSSRSRELLVSVSGTFAIKGLALIVSFLTMPAYLRFFDNQTVLGVWLTIVSAATWVFTFDLGIGNGLRNKLVVALSTKDEDRCSELISSAYFSTAVVGLVICVGGAILIGVLNWNTLLNIEGSVISLPVLRKALGIILAGVVSQFVLKTVNSVLYALQKPATNNAIALITSLLILAWVLFAPVGNAETSIVAVAVAYSVLSNLPLLASTVIVFAGPLRLCRPRLTMISGRASREVVGLGLNFLWAQLMFMLIIGVNEFVVSYLFSPSYVVEYQIYYKLFGLVSSVFSLALTPLWSQITRALCEGDYGWIDKVYRLFHISIVPVFAVEIAIAVFAQPIIDVWMGPGVVVVNPIASVIFVVYGTAYAWQSIESTLACGMGRLRVQNIVYTATTPIRFALVFYLASISSGWYALMLINAATLLLYCVLQWISTSRVIKKGAAG